MFLLCFKKNLLETMGFLYISHFGSQVLQTHIKHRLTKKKKYFYCIDLFEPSVKRSVFMLLQITRPPAKTKIIRELSIVFEANTIYYIILCFHSLSFISNPTEQ